MKLELIPLPCRDVDEAIKFYVEQIGFKLDHDVQPGNGMRVVQLTPPGSSCSIALGTGIGTEDANPVKSLHLVVQSINDVRRTLIAHTVAVSDIQDMGGVQYAYFSDPTGNSWALQQLQ